MNIREQILSWTMVGAYILLNSFGALAIKQTVHRVGKADLASFQGLTGFLATTFMSPLVWIGLFAIALSACAWIIALSRMELSIAYPVAVALNGLIVVAAGFALYGEALSWSKLSGIVLLLCSLVLLFRS